MVAYSFQRQFEPRIEAGIKVHTIRGDRRRHARPGEELQLYIGMRTRDCRLVDRRDCTQVLGVVLRFSGRQRFDLLPVAPLLHGEWGSVGKPIAIADPDAFARADGFDGLDDMGRWWRDVHGRATWHGFLIGWGTPYLEAPAAAAPSNDPLPPPWSADPHGAEPGDVARILRRGGWHGAGLRRYRSAIDPRVISVGRAEDDLVLFEFVAGRSTVGPFAELEQLALALIRFDRGRADDAAWESPAPRAAAGWRR